MTTEEKAKAYDEALEWMRKVYPTLTGADKEDAECYFPELKESEDERIRKELLAVINDLVLPDEQKARFNAWLEKQKEQKPAEWSEEDKHRCGDAIYFLETAKTHYADTSELEKCIEWLKGLNILVEEEPEVDLEKATEEYIEKRASLAPYKRWDIEDMRDAVRFGAKWMKEQTKK